MGRYWKAILATMAGATATTVTAVAQAVGFTVSPEIAAAVAGLLASLAVLIGPRNQTGVFAIEKVENHGTESP